MLEARDRVGGRAAQRRDRRRAERARRRVDRAVPERDARAARRARDRALPRLPRGRPRLHRRRRRAAPLPRRRRDPPGRRRPAPTRRPSRKLDALAAELDPEAPWEHPRAAELDAVSFEQWLEAEVDDTLARDLLRAFMAGGYMTKPADTFSLLSALATVAGAGSVANLFEPDLCLHSRVVGGSQLIPLRLAERLGDRVVLDAPCARCAGTTDGVELEAGADPRLRPRGDRRRAAERGRADPLRAVAARLAHAPAPGDDPGRRDQGARRLRRAVLARGGARRRRVRALPARARGVRQHAAGRAARRALHVPRRREGRRRPSASTRPSGERLVLEGLARFFGPRALEAIEVIERDWSQEEWTRGAYAATFGVGGLSRYGPDLTPARRPDPLGLHRPRRRRPHAHGGRDPLRPGGGPRRPRSRLSSGASLPA